MKGFPQAIFRLKPVRAADGACCEQKFTEYLLPAAQTSSLQAFYPFFERAVDFSGKFRKKIGKRVGSLFEKTFRAQQGGQCFRQAVGEKNAFRFFPALGFFPPQAQNFFLSTAFP